MNNYISSIIKSIQLTDQLTKIDLVETHISWILLTGKYAYKIKKPVNLGFLDFSSLKNRHFYCQEELRLNSRLAPEIYLAVVPITGTYEHPQLNGNGKEIDYAVKMTQFPLNAELSYVVGSNGLTNEHIDNLAKTITLFHQKIDKTTHQSQWGTAKLTHQSTLDTFTTLLENLNDKNAIERVSRIQDWINQFFKENKVYFQERHNEGFIRECHGDLHLRNIALIDSNIILFDGIEFSESLRWIDVFSEIAFLIMDLQHQKLNLMAYRFLNAYLESTGDYRGLRLLRYYLVYRTIVRAMVAALRANQDDVSDNERAELSNEFNAYVTLAETYIIDKKPVLTICHGLSASGKSTVSQSILENLPAIRLRSDVERKRLFGYDKYQQTSSDVGRNIYDGNSSKKTYEILKELTSVILQSNYNVIVDATFLSKYQRREFQLLAINNEVEFVIFDFSAPNELLRARINKRTKNNKEVSEADINVLEYQIENQDVLSLEESDFAIKIDTQLPFSFQAVKQQLQKHLSKK